MTLEVNVNYVENTLTQTQHKSSAFLRRAIHPKMKSLTKQVSARLAMSSSTQMTLERSVFKIHASRIRFWKAQASARIVQNTSTPMKLQGYVSKIPATMKLNTLLKMASAPLAKITSHLRERNVVRRHATKIPKFMTLEANVHCVKSIVIQMKLKSSALQIHAMNLLMKLSSRTVNAQNVRSSLILMKMEGNAFKTPVKLKVSI